MGANFIPRSKRGLPTLRKQWSNSFRFKVQVQDQSVAALLCKPWSKQLPAHGASSKRYSGTAHIASRGQTASGSGINIGPDAYYRNFCILGNGYPLWVMQLICHPSYCSLCGAAIRGW